MSGKERDEASIFNAARLFDSHAAREDYLQGACGDDPALYDRVATLLRAHDAEPRFLESPAAGPVATANLPLAAAAPGMQIGPYKLLEQIGEGGLGVVYLAEQQQPVRRRVALKLIKPGMDSREIIRRFQAERQALALMDHPNIAKVLDAGTTDTGHPYFVMELIKGVAITTYCEQCQFTTRQRLELFVAVCHAVQHAHQKGIIHRDIKPTNVLIAMQDGQPVPKVIDFGVAKAINHRLTDETLHTQFTHMVGTPLYMSPEQAEMSQLDIDTRSDVYSLGVLLYELLTGTTPFTSERLKEASYDEFRRIIREEDPPKPSSRISTEGHLATTVAGQQRTDLRGLTRMIRGDLDWIVMKAMEKDRGRRYETASALAADVERHLADEAVEARPPSAVYQFNKFYRRNRLPLTAAAIVLTATIVGVGVSTTMIAAERDAAQASAEQERLASEEADQQRAEAERQKRLADVKAAEAERQRQRAEANLQQARDAVDRWLTRASDQLANTPGTTKIREALLTEALEFYQGFLDQKSDDPVIRRETGFAYARVSGILHQLGRYDELVEPVQKSVAIFEELAAEFKDSAEHRQLLADSYQRLASAYFFSSRGEEAVKTGQHTLRLYEQLAKDFPDEPEYRRRLAFHYTNFGNQLQHEEMHEEAEAVFRKALDEWNKFREDFPDQRVHNESIAHAHHWLGSELMRQDRPGEAEPHLRRSLELREKIVANTDADLPHPRHQLGHVQQYLATLLLDQGKPEQAEQLARASMKIFERLDELYPDEFDYRKRHHNALDQLARALHAMQRYEEAEEVLIRAHELRRAMLTAEGNEELSSYGFAWSKYNLGLIDHHFGRIDSAATQFREALALFEAQLADRPQFVKFQNALRWVLLTCPLEQFRDTERALELSKQLLQQRPESADYWSNLGLAQYRAGDWSAAIEALEKSIGLSDGGSSFDFYPLAMAHWQLGDKEKARHWYDRGVQHKENSEGSQNLDLLNLRAETEALLGIEATARDTREPETEPDPDDGNPQ